MGVSGPPGVGAFGVSSNPKFADIHPDEVGSFGVSADGDSNPLSWVLFTGIWNDAAFWDDEAFWNDGT